MELDRWTAVTELAATQWGLVATNQLVSLGMTDPEIAWARASGRFASVRRGVHLVAGSPVSPYHPVLAACLATGPSTVGSHLSAAWLWGFDRVRADHVEVTTTLAAPRQLTDVRTHTTSKLLPGDIDVCNGVPVTSPARSAVDLASVLTEFLLARFIDHIRRRRLASYTDVAAHLEVLGGRGRSGTRKLRAVLAPRLEGLDAGDTDAEVRVVEALLHFGVPRPEQNVQVVAGTRVYIVDLAWPAFRIAVELDGFDPHGLLRTTFDNDKDRDLRLKRVGWELIHITTRTDLRLLATYLLERLSGSHLTSS